ncbi:MAG: mechanosensitive ion channel domain-containing protein [Candidatus Woesearchaeota archaeon]
MIETIQEWITWIIEVVAGGMTTLLTAAVIVLVGFILGRVVFKFLKKVLKEAGLNKILKEITRIRIPLEEVISYFVMYFIYFIAIIMALRHIGIATDVLNIISIVIIVLVGVFVLLSIKDFVPNAISGIVLHQKRTIIPGDSIEVHGVAGKVVEVSLLETRLETKKGDIIIVPNANLTKNEIIKKKGSKKKSKK